jgi:hypothetical protein
MQIIEINSKNIFYLKNKVVIAKKKIIYIINA